jgi:hypothetical protein
MRAKTENGKEVNENEIIERLEFSIKLGTLE